MSTLDKPVECGAEDLLGRKGFMRRVTTLLRGTPEGDSVRVAIYGDWGEGKTSVTLSANVGETPAPLGITVGRWQVRTDGSRDGHDDLGGVGCTDAGG